MSNRSSNLAPYRAATVRERLLTEVLQQPQSVLNQKFATKLAVGRTPSCAPDPLVRLCHHTRNGGRRGRRPRTRGSAPRREFSSELLIQTTIVRSLEFMDEVGPGFQPAGAFQAPRHPLTGKVPTPRRSTAAAQKGWRHFFHGPLGRETSVLNLRFIEEFGRRR